MDGGIVAIAVICGGLLAVGCVGMSVYQYSEGETGEAVAWLVAAPVVLVLGAVLIGLALIVAVVWALGAVVMLALE